ncbi:hypothetical protein HY501_02020 [Candidatus Woesearchaeota archaeon]|nr:hypothetical protein [Candidatus Woesearchaeota archaeon]
MSYHNSLSGIIADLEGMGFFDVALPFLLVFTLFFAILQKINLFGENKKNINVVVALVTAFFVLRSPAVIKVMSLFLPKVSMIVLIIIMALIVLGIFGMSGEGITGGYFFVAMVLTFGGLAWAVISSLPSFSFPYWLKIDTANLGVLLGVGVIIGAIFFLIRGDKTGDNSGGKFFEKLGEHFGAENFRGGGGRGRSH